MTDPSHPMNPWMADMRKLQGPADAGPSVSVGGFELPLDADRCVEVPSKHAIELLSHGFTQYVGPAKAKK